MQGSFRGWGGTRGQRQIVEASEGPHDKAVTYFRADVTYAGGVNGSPTSPSVCSVMRVSIERIPLGFPVVSERTGKSGIESFLRM